MKPVLCEHKENLIHDYFISHKITKSENHFNTYHIHDAIEVILIRKGTVSVVVNDKKWDAHDNSVLFFNPTELHGLVPKSDIYDRYVMYFKPDFLETLHPESIVLLQCFYIHNEMSPNHIVLSEKEFETLCSLFDQIICCYENSDEVFGKKQEQQYLIALALIKLNRLYGINDFTSLSHIHKEYQLVFNTIIYIQKNIDNHLSLSQLAAINYVGKNQLCYAFSKAIGLSPMQYVVKARIAKAKHLLLENYSIEEVCNQCGFKSLSHFSRTFKTQVGASPRNFRKQMIY